MSYGDHRFPFGDRSRKAVPAAELRPLSAGAPSRQGLLRLRHVRQALPGFDRRHRRQRAGLRASAPHQGDPRAGRAACSTPRIFTTTSIRARWRSASPRASGLERVFFSNSGTESMEGALKMARSHGTQDRIRRNIEFVSLENSFHGRTFGALSITGQEKYRRDFEPLLPGVHFVPRNDIDRARTGGQRSHRGDHARAGSGRGRHLSRCPPSTSARRASWPIATTRC